MEFPHAWQDASTPSSPRRAFAAELLALVTALALDELDEQLELDALAPPMGRTLLTRDLDALEGRRHDEQLEGRASERDVEAARTPTLSLVTSLAHRAARMCMCIMHASQRARRARTHGTNRARVKCRVHASELEHVAVCNRCSVQATRCMMHALTRPAEIEGRGPRAAAGYLARIQTILASLSSGVRRLALSSPGRLEASSLLELELVRAFAGVAGRGGLRGLRGLPCRTRPEPPQTGRKFARLQAKTVGKLPTIPTGTPAEKDESSCTLVPFCGGCGG